MHSPASPSPNGALGPLPDGHPPVRLGRVGVLLVNLGTPEKATAASVRTYLREFLSDSRVVDYPKALWLPVLYGVILNVRPAKTAALYRAIWREESDESPLRYYTRRQAEEVAKGFGDEVIVDWAMRYGSPSIEERIHALQAEGCDRILVVPLYPQYSGSTTATVVDKVGEVLARLPFQPTVRVAPPFPGAEGYIDALEVSMRAHVPADAERVILSFHGIPERYFKNGDPYHCHCQKTARLLRKRMGWDDTFAPLAFQSKFGPETWLEPSTESLVEKAAEEGLKRIAITAPAFVSDCIETLEEIGIGLRETFEEAGGETLTPIPCLNDDEAFVQFLRTMIEQELAGWIKAPTAVSAAAE